MIHMNNAADTNTDNAAPRIGSELVAAIETMWASVREWFPELPARVVVVTGSGKVKGGTVLGHWAEGRWTTDDGKVAELFISGEQIGRGGRGVAETVLHEAAHALRIVRGDLSGGTSRQGRYHNRAFVETAEELGLVGPESPDKVLGWSACTLSDFAEMTYGADIDALEAAIGARIVMIGEAELRTAAVAVGALLGGLNVVVPWWLADSLAGVWAGLGGAVKPAPRTRRPAVKFACDCRSFKVPAAEADEHEDLTCGRCGFPMMRSE